MTTPRPLRSLRAATLGACAALICGTASAIPVVFETDFSTDTMHVTPNVISPTAANWHVMSSRNATGSSVNGFGGLTITNAASTSTVVEATARLTPYANALNLASVGDFIEATGVFYTDWMLNIAFGFYDSGNVDPLVVGPNGTTLLRNSGLGSTAGAVGGTLGWKGYRAQAANTSTAGNIVARFPQTGTPTYQAYDLVTVGTGGFNSPGSTSIGSIPASASSVTWANGFGAAYRFIYRIERTSASAHSITLTIRDAADTSPSGSLYSVTGVTNTATQPSSVTSLFDSFAVGYRNRPDGSIGTIGALSLTSLKVTARTSNIARIVTQPANQTIVEGGSGSISVVAAGDAPLTYQWFKDASPISGATSASLPITAASSADIGTYTVRVSNAFGYDLSANAAVSVTAATAPDFNLDPVSQSVNAGTTLILTSNASGTPTPTYQWFLDGNPISGATSSTYTVENVTTAAQGSYYVVATNSQGSDQSASATVTVVTAAPQITSQPAALTTINVADALNLSVTATGIPTPTYQWFLNGDPILNATSSVYGVASATTADQGTYTVTVTNSVSSVTSENASVVVNVVPPTVSAPPVNTTVVVGNSLLLTAGYTGSQPRTYQWFRNSVAIEGATGSSYSVPVVSLANAGSYHVVVTNSAGFATSDPAVVSVVFASENSVFSTDFTTSTLNNPAQPITPTGTSWYIIASRVSTNSNIGDDSATAEIVEARPLTMKFNTTTGSSIVEAAGRFAAAPIDLDDEGDFLRMTSTLSGKNLRILAFGMFNSNGVNPVALWGNPAADILGSGTAAAGLGTTLWKGYRSSMQVGSNTGDIGTRPAQTASITNRGNELIFPAGSTGTAFGEPAGVSVGTVPGVGATIAYTDDTVYTLVYTIARSGGNQLTIGYKLFVGASASGSPIYSTEATTTAAGALPSDVTRSFDSVAIGFRNLDTSVIPELTLTNLQIVHGTAVPASAPSFTTHPASQNLAPGDALTLTAVASGFPAPTYQWFLNDDPISGATSATYSVPSVGPEHAGNYTVVATNDLSSATSNVAVIEVGSPANAYDTWATGFGLDPLGNGAPTANPSLDGVANMIKFVLGGNPNLAGTTPLPVLAKPSSYTVTYRVKTASLPLFTATIETTSALGSAWQPAVHGVGGVSIVSTPIDAETNQVVVTIPAGAGNLFARLVVTPIL